MPSEVSASHGAECVGREVSARGEYGRSGDWGDGCGAWWRGVAWWSGVVAWIGSWLSCQRPSGRYSDRSARWPLARTAPVSRSATHVDAPVTRRSHV